MPAITQQLTVGGFVLEIDSDRPIFTGLAGLFLHGSPSPQWIFAVYGTP
jgi:hypothetical protein